jgi:hypothetical protein
VKRSEEEQRGVRRKEEERGRIELGTFAVMAVMSWMRCAIFVRPSGPWYTP